MTDLPEFSDGNEFDADFLAFESAGISRAVVIKFAARYLHQELAKELCELDRKKSLSIINTLVDGLEALPTYGDTNFGQGYAKGIQAAVRVIEEIGSRIRQGEMGV